MSAHVWLTDRERLMGRIMSCYADCERALKLRKVYPEQRKLWAAQRAAAAALMKELIADLERLDS
jgi:hypothetical protein